MKRRLRLAFVVGLIATPALAAPPRTPAPAAPAAAQSPAPAPSAAPITDVPPVEGAPVTDVAPPQAAGSAPVPPAAEAPSLADLGPPARKKLRVHDGLYLGFQSGPAYFSATSEWERGSANIGGSREFSGPSVAFWFGFGGTFAKRIALAGVLMLEPVFSLSAKDENGDELDVSDTTFFLRGEGLMIDYYVSPSGGLHMLGALGFAQLDVDRPGTNSNDDDPSGSFWSLGVGYEWWAGDESSVGVLARVSNASLESHETSEEVDVEAFSFGLHVTATMN